MPRLLASLDVFVSSSAFGEGMPTVVGEAMACGVPCVVTDVGDSALMVGETGLVVPPQEPGELARAVGEALTWSASCRGRAAAKQPGLTSKKISTSLRSPRNWSPSTLTWLPSQLPKGWWNLANPLSEERPTDMNALLDPWLSGLAFAAIIIAMRGPPSAAAG